ncbi:epoxide hydrolase [Sphingobium sp. H39-3-25]|uniref:epoxide hydrolase family protein n=1 Tax=Sphingobium arseniciresistens TaxID=3030834 RepID=UPI0023B8F0F1|nr:epoxide hydrolase [Sphingobium arseniciresistens]
MSDAVEAFSLAVPESQIEDLRGRLARTRWPEREPVGDESQGVSLDRMRSLCDYWRTRYDWRRCEARLNALGQYRAEIDGLGLHFLHIRSPAPRALPLIMTHGWPGSVIEFLKVVGPLTDPTAYGGDPGDAFDLVLPTLPGFGFSGKPATTGWGVERIADAWITLMRRLGYGRYVAQGGDWGAAVTHALALRNPPECVAAHLTVARVRPTDEQRCAQTPAEAAALSDHARFMAEGTGYSLIQSTRPQTIGYGLTDSPAAQAAWIYDKYDAWTDHKSGPEEVLGIDEMLDNIMMYWLPSAAASSARLYRESAPAVYSRAPVTMPVGFSIFPKEIWRASRRWAEPVYTNIIHWNEPVRGGHFAAFEQPGLFVDELRACFRTVR